MSLDEWIEVADFSAVGRVIRDLAVAPPAQRPSTPTEFETLCNNEGAGMVIHDSNVTKLVFVEPVPLDTMMVVLPNPQFLGTPIGGADPRSYPIGAYYRGAFECVGGNNNSSPPVARKMSNPQEIEAFRMFRIGEYCTNKCM